MVETTTHGKIPESIQQRLFARENSLNEIKFVKFWDAVINSDPEVLGLTETELELLLSDYYSLINKTSIKEKRLKKMEVEIEILKNVLTTLSATGYNQTDSEILESLNLKKELYPDNVKAYLEFLTKEIDARSTKYKFVQGALPKGNKKVKQVSAYTLLGNLTNSLGFGIGKFDEITVTEYISYSLSLKEKNKAEELARESSKNKRHGKR